MIILKNHINLTKFIFWTTITTTSATQRTPST